MYFVLPLVAFLLHHLRRLIEDRVFIALIAIGTIIVSLIPTIHEMMIISSGYSAIPSIVSKLANYGMYVDYIVIGYVLHETTPLAKYRALMEKESFQLFHHAPALIIIYAKKPSLHPHEDCALAAQNLMLTAADLGLGSCWIGFSLYHFNRSEIKKTLQIPEEYEAIAPIVVGYPQTNHLPIPKKAPEIICWHK